MDVNDNAPYFESNFIDIELIPDTLNSSFVTLANDLDSGENARLEYKLLTKQNFFGIESKTGVISALKKLKKDSEYFLSVKATDNGNPSLSGWTILRVRIPANVSSKERIYFKSNTFK